MGEPVILASASPTRQRLLAAAGLDVEIVPALVDEEKIRHDFATDRQDIADCALALAEAKARQVANHHLHCLVIGADQILACGKRWFSKPTDLGDARTQLRLLRGRDHELITAACVVRDTARIWHAISRAKLTMRQFSDAFLETYLIAEQAAILGSVGAYRLEGRGAQLFSAIRGDYFAILGLPLLELLGFLRTRGALEC